MPDANGSKLIIAIVSSLLVACFALTLISLKSQLPVWISAIMIPIYAYISSVIFGAIFQYSNCNTFDGIAIAKSDIIILLTNTVVSLVLFAEAFPILRYIFGPFAPRDQITGLPYENGTAQYDMAMENENHYKIQFFSNIVKEVIPVYAPENVKDGLVYFYWNFWATLLPIYFLLSVQGLCQSS